MGSGVILGSEAIRAGLVTRHELSTTYVARHKDVYVPRGIAVTPTIRAEAAWLRSRRQGVLAGFSAAALHGRNGLTHLDRRRLLTTTTGVASQA